MADAALSRPDPVDDDAPVPDYGRPGGPWDGPPLADLPPPAVVDGASRRGADEVRELAGRLAAGLAARGVEPGDVVVFQFPPGEAALLGYLACWTLGAVAAPLHHRAGAAEVAGLLARLRPRLVLPEVPGWLARRPADPVPVPDDAAAVLLATSGSSGRPKLVRHTRRALAYKARVMPGVHGLRPTDVVLVPAPLAHVSGLLNGVLLPGAAGMTVVFLARWRPAAALALVEAERVSFMIGPPTYFVQLAAEPAFDARAVRSLRLVSCGGAGVDEHFARTAAETFGAVVKRTYGSTEAPTVTTSRPGDPPELGWCTDGRPVGEVALRVDRRTGELSVRGPELFAGYDDPVATAAAFGAQPTGTAGGSPGDGFFRTGDRAELVDGWLRIIGRLTDTIVRGGENVDPAEVEAVCARLPGVRQAVAVGYPDPVMGERIGLVLVASPGPSLAAVRAHCNAQGLAGYKTPERLLVLDQLPVRTVGKPDRAALRVLLTG